MRVDPLRGDTTIAGLDLVSLYSSPLGSYAKGKEWFEADEPIRLGGVDFAKNAPALRYDPTDLLRVGEFEGVPVFAEKGGAVNPSIIYVLVDHECRFQPYYLIEGRPPR
jgi:hypothetical protein